MASTARELTCEIPLTRGLFAIVDAQITVEGRRISLGLFVELEDAAEARRLATTELHGRFARQ